ncbi:MULTISPECIES: DUF4259 domain-containing protein [Deinococcus]|uniref:DUF4259 domain-containing protein n=1 Tax=Deinococcus rufus TaxID=2136097 RepID=A0ABV7ZFX0_9DEIO|nr:DUF4259 domain-containing protein [Deinococcus sp. AB2017081]WQE93843.1 DUF4259 domain-containing protein [Deinococcus sp. AB2017081]
MGTWGTGSFDNDSAADFIREVVEDGAVALREALEVVLDPDLDYIEAEEGSRAIAAAEVIAAITSGDHRNITDDDLLAWVEGTDGRTLSDQREPALEALERVLGPDSELPELWEESDDRRDWQRDVQRLRASLG